jgi:glyoxylase-like metal-dependent hydrolase (beta-lactamase superfamily II)
LTHNHFDHILGSSAFADATVYCAPEVAATIAGRTEELRADAVRHGADADEGTSAIAPLRVPRHRAGEAGLDLGGRLVTITHPGPGHTNHDVIVVVADAQPAVVFCGDLVEESGDPVMGPTPTKRPGPRRSAGCSLRAGRMRHMRRGTGRSSTRSSSSARADAGHRYGVTDFALPA